MKEANPARTDPCAASDDSPTVTVVIPTTLRPSVEASIASVAEQSYARSKIEILVVVDAQEDSASSAERQFLRTADRVIYTGGRLGGGFARDLGVDAAQGELVAFLDDDDVWLPDKLRKQTHAIHVATNPGRVIVSCRVREFSSAGHTSDLVPAVVYTHGRVEDYLFRGRGPSVARPSIFTSTLITSKALAQEIGWSPQLKRHQDWDWLVRAGARPGVEIVQLEADLVRYSLGSPQSISGTFDWRSSLAWAAQQLGVWHSQTLSDFIAGQPLRYALSAHSWPGVRECLALLGRTRRLPGFRPLMLGFAGLVSRRQLERLFFLRTSRGAQSESASLKSQGRAKR